MAKCVGARYSRGAVARQQYGVAPPWPLGYTALATRSFERHRIAARGVRHRRGTAGWLVGRRFAAGLIRAVRVAPHTCRCTSQRCGDDAACPRLTPQRGGDLSHCHRRHRMSRRCRKSVTKMSQWCREMSRKCHKNVTDLSRTVTKCHKASQPRTSPDISRRPPHTQPPPLPPWRPPEPWSDSPT